MIISRAHSACNPPLEHRKRALRPRRFMALAPIPYHTRGIPRQQVAAGGGCAEIPSDGSTHAARFALRRVGSVDYVKLQASYLLIPPASCPPSGIRVCAYSVCADRGEYSART